jgi:hypothetical protein
MQASLTYMATPRGDWSELQIPSPLFCKVSARSLQGLCKASARSPHTVLKPASLNSARRYLLAPRVQGLCDFLFNVLVYSPECAVALPATEFVASLTSFAKRVLLGAAARIAVRCRCRHFPSLLRRCSPPCPVCDQHNTCDTPARAPLPLPPSPTTSSHHHLGPGLPRMIPPLLPPPQPTACA